jgi:hypothetical protein
MLLLGISELHRYLPCPELVVILRYPGALLVPCILGVLQNMFHTVPKPSGPSISPVEPPKRTYAVDVVIILTNLGRSINRLGAVQALDLGIQ